MSAELGHQADGIRAVCFAPQNNSGKEAIPMRAFQCSAVLVLLAFLLPAVPAAVAGEVVEAVTADELDAAIYQKYPKVDHRISALEDEFASSMQVIVDRLRNESEPTQQMSLQKEIQRLKEDQLIATAELQLEIALEQGNERLVEELEEILLHFALPEVKVASAVEERFPPSGAEPEKMRTPRRDPDDVP